jgi:hypothetical protein
VSKHASITHKLINNFKELHCFRLAVLDSGSSADFKVINYFKHCAGVNSKELSQQGHPISSRI